MIGTRYFDQLLDCAACTKCSPLLASRLWAYGLSPVIFWGRARMLTWIFVLASQEDLPPGGGGVDFKITRLKGFARKKVWT